MFENPLQVMVMGFIGKMGSGKTLNMSKWALFLSAIFKMDIYSNYHLKTAHFFKNWKELENKRNIIICMDEIHVLFDSRDWDNKARYAFTHWFVQLRKRGIIFLYTTQRTDTLEKRIRNHTDWIMWCKSTRNFAGELTLTETLLDTQLSLDNAVVVKTYKNANPKMMYNLYDTSEIINE